MSNAALMEELEKIDAARNANRDSRGRIKNDRQDRRLCAKERALCVAALGWKPEDLSSRETRYAATTGEIRRWALHG